LVIELITSYREILIKNFFRGGKIAVERNVLAVMAINSKKKAIYPSGIQFITWDR